jgi:hypothetical protein
MTEDVAEQFARQLAIPVERTMYVQASDKICLSVDYSPLPFETHAVLTGIEDHFNRKIRGPEEAKNLFSQSVRCASSPFKIRLIPHIMNPFYP